MQTRNCRCRNLQPAAAYRTKFKARTKLIGESAGVCSTRRETGTRQALVGLPAEFIQAFTYWVTGRYGGSPRGRRHTSGQVPNCSQGEAMSRLYHSAVCITFIAVHTFTKCIRSSLHTNFLYAHLLQINFYSRSCNPTLKIHKLFSFKHFEHPWMSTVS